MTQHRSIHWFRKGLRLHDNPAFIKACEHASEVYPIFILDPWFAKSSNCRVGVKRWQFLLQSLQDLDNSLKALNLRLFVVRGNPHKQMESLCQKWKISLVTFEVDTEPYAVKRDEEVEGRLREIGVEVIKCVSHTLYDTARTVKANGGSPPLTYQRFQTVASKLGAPDKPLDAPTKSEVKDCKTPISDKHEEEFGVPSLAELGKDEESCGPLLYPGGETEALARMERNLKKVNWVCSFEKPQTSPNSLDPSTTVLSPYLKFGCLSPRLFFHQLADVYRGKKHSQPPVSLHGQLLWREFFYTVGSATPNFDKMVGNPVCRQIPWGSNPDHLERWTKGQTGFPFIDAIMRQLNLEGWIHHLARHAVACFLTRGDLWISWEEGMKVFEELLLDADWSLNAGNWMWLSASAFFHQYFRVYSPIAFGKKTDSNGDYIRKYVPEVKKFPAKFIYEPWTAPLATQKAAGCLIGKDYPRPIVDHSVASKANMARMAAAYNANKKDKPSNGSANSQKDTKTKTKKRPSNEKDGMVQKKLKFS